MFMFILRTARSAACSLPARSAASLLSFSLSLALAIVVAAPRPARAATTTGQVRGRVTGPDGKPLGGVTVVLANDLSGHRQEATTGADGTYLLYNVPPNPYHLTIEIQGFQPYHADVDVRGSAPVVKDIALAVTVTATEAVHAEAEGVELESDTSMTHVDIDKSLIRQTAAAIPSRAFESIVTSTPGFSPGRERPVPLPGRPLAAAPRRRRPADRRPDRHHVLELARPGCRGRNRDRHGRHPGGIRGEGERRHQPHDAFRPRVRARQG